MTHDALRRPRAPLSTQERFLVVLALAALVGVPVLAHVFPEWFTPDPPNRVRAQDPVIAAAPPPAAARPPLVPRFKAVEVYEYRKVRYVPEDQ